MPSIRMLTRFAMLRSFATTEDANTTPKDVQLYAGPSSTNGQVGCFIAVMRPMPRCGSRIRGETVGFIRLYSKESGHCVS
jgi:hypothetical protein